MTNKKLCRICKEAEAEPDSSRFDPLCQPCADAWLKEDEESAHEKYLDAKDRYEADAYDRFGDR